MKKNEVEGAKNKYCSRCGSDLLSGGHLIYLPFENKYVSLCFICTVGLAKVFENFPFVQRTPEEIKDFWNKDESENEPPKPTDKVFSFNKPKETNLGFTGDKCPQCGSMRMVQNGTCKKCMDCGETTGCS